MRLSMTRQAEERSRRDVTLRLILSVAFWLASGVWIHGQEAPSTEPLRLEASGNAYEFLRDGDRLAKKKQYVPALEAWARGYVVRLPEWRQLEFLHPVNVHFMSRDELRAFLIASFDQEYPEEMFRRDEICRRHLGFFGPDVALRETMLDVLTEEIAGFYDTNTKGLYLFRYEEKAKKKRSFIGRLFASESEFDPDEQKIVIAHELAHALADQHFDLHSTMHSVMHDDDMSLAYSAVVEGEATLVMIMAGGEVSPEDLDQFFQGLPTVARTVQLVGSLAAPFGSGGSFRKAPLIVKESLLFPYLKGFVFCSEVVARGGWRSINRAFGEPPLSTEQILHPEKALGRDYDAPLALRYTTTSPLEGTVWQLVRENVVGEFGIEVLLRPRLAHHRSTAAAAGWDGDLYRVYEQVDHPSERTLLVWGSTWDSVSDAEEFASALAVHFEVSEHEVLATPPGLAEAEYFWRQRLGISGIWRDGKDVWVLDRIPAAHLAGLLEWAFTAHKEPKKLQVRKVESKLGFPK